MKLKLEVSQYIIKRFGYTEVVPKWYGLAWRKWNSDVGVFMPIPLNYIVSGLIRIWWHFRLGLYPTILWKIYEDGVAAGKSAEINVAWLRDEWKDSIIDKLANRVFQAQYDGVIKALSDKYEFYKWKEEHSGKGRDNQES